MVGILDWGLGHATRMIPLVQHLLQFQCQILIAATGPQRMIIEKTFPGITILSPPNYGVRYSRNGKNLIFGLIRQLPRLLRVIKAEQKWALALSEKYPIDMVISDNRYGMKIPGTYSVILTHQIAPISGLGRLADTYIRKMHTKFLMQFNECWIPDAEKGGLSGNLSHNIPLPPNARYIGPLSRFNSETETITPSGKLLILISGPEPRRTAFEEMILEQLKTYDGPYTLVRGLPGSAETMPNTLNHAPAEVLQELIRNAGFIICRAGYTTIMDLAALGRTAVLVPTPGQSEQEYLAKHLSDAGRFLSCSENTFDLKREVSRLRNFAPTATALNFQQYKLALQELLNKLNAEV